ncbi:hypothetical protein [Streptomyces sp. CB03911]|uniref:hypothetical protein n=1 Tax=Streptomyces sp. CB03911 TaxID=1804758 RepID=UPI00093C372D|nr:hypothetical protein [Streptomyces sp. CB03911]OKI16552.1 hypothetical protein A6A07_11115 [Streptomyces sp. CB03911]
MTQPLDLAPIQGRYEMYAAIHSKSGKFAHCPAQESAEDVPALLAEVTRLRAELTNARASAVHEAARLLEAAGHDDDAVNFLDGWADYDQPAPAPTV